MQRLVGSDVESYMCLDRERNRVSKCYAEPARNDFEAKGWAFQIFGKFGNLFIDSVVQKQN